MCITLKERMQRLSDLNQQVEDAEASVYSERAAIRNTLGEQLGIDSSKLCFYLEGEEAIGWDCPTSPIGVCVYNELDDPLCDGCLYCGMPHERK